MKTVLVAVDLSGATPQVCRAAEALAHANSARLLIAHVVPPVPYMMSYYDIGLRESTLLMRSTRKRAATKLQALLHWCQKRHPDTKVAQRYGPAVPGLLRLIAEAKPDYVVIGSHGHTATFELLVGSVAHGVLRKCPVPILLVPIRKRPSPRASATAFLAGSFDPLR